MLELTSSSTVLKPSHEILLWKIDHGQSSPWCQRLLGSLPVSKLGCSSLGHQVLMVKILQVINAWEALSLCIKYIRHGFVYSSLSSNFYAQQRLRLTKLGGKEHPCADVRCCSHSVFKVDFKSLGKWDWVDALMSHPFGLNAQSSICLNCKDYTRYYV